MNIGPEEAGRLDLKTYDGLLHNWNKMHDPAGSDGDQDFGQLRTAMEAHRSLQ